MFTGTVKWFNNTKGFGFVVPEAKNPEGEEQGPQTVEARDIFAHYSEIDMTGYKALKAGQLVTFDIKNGDKGEQATNIRPISKIELDKYRDGSDEAPEGEPSAQPTNHEAETA